MRIVIALLILGVASSSATSENSVTTPTTKLKRDITTPSAATIIWPNQPANTQAKPFIVPFSSTLSSSLDAFQAATVVSTIPVHNPLHGLGYNSYSHPEINIRTQDTRGSSSTLGEIIHQPNSALPSVQGGFQASPVQNFSHRVSHTGFNQDLPPYTPQATQRFQNKILGNKNSQYFSAPNTYKYVPESDKDLASTRIGSYPVSGTFPPFPKFKKSPSALSSSSFGDHSFETLPKYNFNTQSSPLGSSSNSPLYESTSYPSSKNSHIGPTSFSSEFSSSSSFTPFDKPGHNYQEYGSGLNIGYDDKKTSLPISPQVHNTPEVSGYVNSVENEPLLLKSGLDYENHSPQLSYDFSKPSSASLSNGPRPFTSPIQKYQPRASQTYSSKVNGRIPPYKGASFSSNEYSKPGSGYQLLANQPQLHFTPGTPGHSVDYRPPIVYHAQPFEQIRSDAEVINKKKLTTPRPYDSDEHDFDEGFKAEGRDFGFVPGDDSNKPPPEKVTSRGGSFEIPRSNLFNSYDEAFGKYSKLASLDKDTEERRSPIVDHSTKPVYQSVEEEDDGESVKSSGEYRSSYTNEKEPNASYESEDEEESQKNERQESSENLEKDDEYEFAPYKSEGHDFEKEFEESYSKELPKSDYTHVKEVPEIEESSSESKKRLANGTGSKSSRSGSKQKNKRVTERNYEKPKKYESYTTHEYERAPKNLYRDSEGHGSRTTYRKTTSAEPRPEETYGHKILSDRGTTKHAKKGGSGPRETDREEWNNRKSAYNQETRQNRDNKYSRPSSSTQKPSTTAISTNDKFPKFPPFSSWKSNKKSSQVHDSYGAPSQIVQAIFNPNNVAYHSPELHQETLRYSTNGQIIRDLTGI